MSLAGLLCAVITGPCGWVEFVEALLVFVDFSGFPVQSNIMIAGVVQYFCVLK